MIKIIIAEDQQMMIDGLKSLLNHEKNMTVIGEALNGEELLKMIEKKKPDVVLMDVRMPVMDGIEATQQISQRFPNIKVLMLTMHNTREYIEKLIKSGCAGYILKNTGKRELMTAIETVNSGEKYYSKEVTERFMESFQLKKNAHSEIPVELTEREKDVLKLIAQEFKTNEIADKLFISHHTVETHRKNLISKLNVRNTAGLVRYAIENDLTI
jgi:DNA-binding NarL/FixJ family response regulator